MKKYVLVFCVAFSVFFSVSHIDVSAQTATNTQPVIEEVSLLQRIIRWFFNWNTDTKPKLDEVIQVPVTDVTTYTNPKFGVHVVYPKSLYTELSSEHYCKGRADCNTEMSEDLYIYNYSVNDAEYDSLRKVLSGNDFRIRVSMTKHSKPVALKDMVPSYNEAHDKVISQKVVLNGFDAAIIKNEWGFPVVYYLVNKNVEVKIFVEYKDADNTTQKIVENIVSSFKFVAKNDGPVTGSTVKVISPNGGESYTVGDDLKIEWWDDRDAGNFDIYITDLKHQGTEVSIQYDMFARSSGFDGTYTKIWKIGDLPAGKYSIEVRKTGSLEHDLSDNFFMIR